MRNKVCPVICQVAFCTKFYQFGKKSIVLEDCFNSQEPFKKFFEKFLKYLFQNFRYVSFLCFFFPLGQCNLLCSALVPFPSFTLIFFLLFLCSYIFIPADNVTLSNYKFQILEENYFYTNNNFKIIEVQLPIFLSRFLS